MIVYLASYAGLSGSFEPHSTCSHVAVFTSERLAYKWKGEDENKHIESFEVITEGKNIDLKGLDKK